MECPPETEIKIVMRMKDMLGCCRLSTTHAPGPIAPATNYAAVQAALTPAAERTEEQTSHLFEAWRKSLPELQTLNDESEGILKTTLPR